LEHRSAVTPWGLRAGENLIQPLGIDKGAEHHCRRLPYSLMVGVADRRARALRSVSVRTA
jgi:hypothetical protein